MSRDRLTNKTAEDLTVKGTGNVKESKGSGIDNDSYNMNDTGHEKNDPKRDEYAKGDPEAWKEGVNKDNPAKDDQKREETGHAPLIDKHAAAEAVASAKRLEEKAVKCIVASQRILPGASDATIEAQAADLMNLPDNALESTLARQEKLAQDIGGVAEEVEKEAQEAPEIIAKREKLASLEAEAAELKKELTAGDDDDDDDEDDADAEACKKAGDEDADKEKDKEVEAGDEEKDKKDEKKEEVEAGDNKDEKKEEEEVEAGDKKDKEEEEEVEAGDNKDEKKEEEEEEVEAGDKKDKEEEKKEDKKPAIGEGDMPTDEENPVDEKDASEDTNLLDAIFSNAVTASDKKGASKLSGMVKKEASEGKSQLDSIWVTPPDVSHIFGN